MDSNVNFSLVPFILWTLFFIFLTLKLAGVGVVSTWSWWCVTAPLWVPIALAISFLLLLGVASIIIHMVRNR